MGSGCLALFLLPFAAGGLLATGLVARELWFWAEARGWVERRCVIERASLEESLSSDDLTFRNTAEYHYDYDERTYRGSQVSFDWGADNVGDFHQRAQAELEAHRVQGRPFPCFVNPRNPSESVLYRSLRTEKLLLGLLFAIIFDLIGIGGMILALRPGALHGESR